MQQNSTCSTAAPQCIDDMMTALPSSDRSTAPSSMRALKVAISDAITATEPLTQLQQHTSCNICYDTLSVALSLPCFHSFCSLCIRRCLHFNASCPLCHAAATTADLRPNFALSQIAILVANLQSALIRNIEQQTTQWAKEHAPQLANATEEIVHDGADVGDKARAAASSAAIAAASTAATPATSNSSVAAATTKVECPCCGLSIVASRINRHLDDCLGKEVNQQAAAASAAAASVAAASSAAAAAASASSNARLPFPVYNMLSEKQLRKLLSDLGFPSTGAAAAGLDQAREALVRRHREFVLRHNSELDASGCGLRAAVSDAALVKDIVRKERSRASHTQGRQAKQSLLNAFTNDGGNNNGSAPPSSAAATDALMASAPATASSGATSARKRGRRGSSTSSATPVATRTPRKADTATSRNTPTPVLDLSEETSDDARMSDVNITASATSAAAPAAPPTAIPNSNSPSATDVATQAGAPAAAPISSSSSPDPYAAMIAAYEAKHGRRKRWKRRWGIDDSLYPAAETIVLNEDEPPQNAASSTTDATSGSKADDTGTTVAPPAPSASAASPKAVFSLFQPANSHSTAASATAPAVPPSTAVSSNSTTGGGSNNGGCSSSSGVIRVSKVLCSGCRATCRGSFPLGASVLCPKCRPAWTSKIPLSTREDDEEAPPAPIKPTGWMAKAQQPHRPPTSLAIPPAPADSVANIVAAPVPSSSASTIAATAAALSEAQRQAIEERRAAALAKLQKQRGGSEPLSAVTSDSKPADAEPVSAADARPVEQEAMPMEEEKSAPSPI